MLEELLRPDIEEMLQRSRYGDVLEALNALPPADQAQVIRSLKLKDKIVVLEKLPLERSTEIFEFLDLHEQQFLVQSLSHFRVVALLNEMAADNRTALLETLRPSLASRLMGFLKPHEREIAQTLLEYPKDSVGRLMTPEYLAVPSDWTVEDVLTHIRRIGEDKETLNVIYVVDKEGRLLRDVRIRELLVSPLERPVLDLAPREPVALRAEDPQEEAVRAFRKHDRTVLPVTDAEDILLGILTIDDVMDVAEAEHTEDIHKLGGMQALEEPYLNTTVMSMIGKRAGWLVVLLFGEMLTASALGFYEHELARAVVLALFIPMIIASGGNSGSQAATLVIRALALDEVHFRDWWRIVKRELAVGLALGFILGLVGFLRIAVWEGVTGDYGPHWERIAFAIAFSLLGIVAWGTLIGAMLPLFLKRLGLDPATSSAPFVATLIDVTGILIYFNISMLLLKGALL